MSNNSPIGKSNVPPTKSAPKFLHILFAIAFFALFVITIVWMDPRGSDILFWFAASLFPYAAVLALCRTCKGLPKFLRNKAGGIILLSFIIVSHLLIPFVAKILSILFCIAFAVTVLPIIIRLLLNLGPDGYVTTTGRRADGSTYEETRYYYGDGKAEAEKAADDFKNQGYRDINQNNQNYGG